MQRARARTPDHRPCTRCAIDAIQWCTPVNGRIAFAYQEPALVGYAGGLLAAIVLAGIYSFVILPRLTSRPWWTAGVAVLGTAIAQVIVGVWEGSSPQGYGAAQGNFGGFLLLVVGPLVVAAAVQPFLTRLRFSEHLVGRAHKQRDG